MFNVGDRVKIGSHPSLPKGCFGTIVWIDNVDGPLPYMVVLDGYDDFLIDCSPPPISDAFSAFLCGAWALNADEITYPGE